MEGWGPTPEVSKEMAAIGGRFLLWWVTQSDEPRYELVAATLFHLMTAAGAREGTAPPMHKVAAKKPTTKGKKKAR